MIIIIYHSSLKCSYLALNRLQYLSFTINVVKCVDHILQLQLSFKNKPERGWMVFKIFNCDLLNTCYLHLQNQCRLIPDVIQNTHTSRAGLSKIFEAISYGRRLFASFIRDVENSLHIFIAVCPEDFHAFSCLKSLKKHIN
jgi:hypothetical protein